LTTITAKPWPEKGRSAVVFSPKERRTLEEVTAERPTGTVFEGL
jgi:hypothetical protein